MASRNELLIIRAARAGQASAQLALGRRYLFGGNGLPRSPKTALYWLDRAAHQQQSDAWMLIGRHVPFEIARQATRPANLSIWYERAYDAGLAEAGFVYARLVLQQSLSTPTAVTRRKALSALESAAHAGITDAQWLLALQLGHEPGNADGAPKIAAGAAMQWTLKAAENGSPAAQRALAEHGWASADHAVFLRWALPRARALAQGIDASEFMARQLAARDVSLLLRCAQALLRQPGAAMQEIEQFLELAAWARDREAQYRLGLWHAKVDDEGMREAGLAGPAQYKKAIRWLTLAAQQGHAHAWFVLSRIYLKPECSQRNLADARAHLRRAAEAGHVGAQAEFGMLLWRTREHRPDQDVEAAGWLQKAAMHTPAARELLEKMSGPPVCGGWAIAARQALARTLSSQQPFLAARLELAALFGLSRAEALLLDVANADRGHCLLIDVRAARPRSRRRLIMLDTAAQRQALARIARMFDNVAAGPYGPEGSYRQRLYRLNTLLA